MKEFCLALIICIGLSSPTFGAGSPSQPPVAPGIRDYNKGVSLMLDKQFSEAETQFRKALSRNDKLAEAHNNLAYVLRKQGPDNYDEALVHYNMAIELNSALAEPYMYRGVLFVQMNDNEMAERDFQKLQEINPNLATELRFVIDNGSEKEPEQFLGVSKKLK